MELMFMYEVKRRHSSLWLEWRPWFQWTPTHYSQPRLLLIASSHKQCMSQRKAQHLSNSHWR